MCEGCILGAYDGTTLGDEVGLKLGSAVGVYDGAVLGKLLGL